MYRFLEFFSGIGGFHAASTPLATVVGAWDQDARANETYALNWGLRPSARNLESIKAKELKPFSADGWFLSPPCQPYTQKGAQRDIDDPRARPLLNMLEALVETKPRFVLLENVPPFAQSRARERLLQALAAAGLHATEVLLCPTELGCPNRRRRYYLMARSDHAPMWNQPQAPSVAQLESALPEFLDLQPPEECWLPESFAATYGKGMDVVPATGGVTACFGSSYGRARAHAGSYLMDRARVRRFTPEEIAALLCFPRSFRFPSSLSLLDRYRLAGNSVNVNCVRTVLQSLLDQS